MLKELAFSEWLMPKYPMKLLPIRLILLNSMARKDGKESVVIREAILKGKA
jgi:hypothetical protein